MAGSDIIGDWNLADATRKARVRVRSVRFKNGGELRLLPSAREEEHAEVLDYLADAVPELDRRYPNRVAGFALVAWMTGGTAFVRHYFGYGNSEVNLLTAPAFVSEALRRFGR